MRHFQVSLVMFMFVLDSTEGHGRLVEPPSRASAWRYGFNTPVNYNDNQLFCGGKAVQWEQNGGRCGICGDPYSGPREHEAGGRYATGTIVRTYTAGQIMNVRVQLTANHKGWFEFRLCPVNNGRQRATQSCLDQHILPLADGSGTRIPIASDMFDVAVRLRLPRGLTCGQCVLQWKYNTGNSWGVDERTGRGCVGCGAQEQFYGCADISIQSSFGGHPSSQTPSNQNPRPEYRPPRPTSRPERPIQRPGYGHRPPTNNNRPVPSGRGNSRCRAIGAWRGRDGMDSWCVSNCKLGNCPSSHCSCLRP